MKSYIDYSKCRKDARGVYVLGYSQIENSIDSFLKKEHPKVLAYPQEVPVENWIDSGEFGFSLEFRDLVFPQAKGFTAFSKMVAGVKNSGTGSIELVPIEENTVVLDETEEDSQSHFTAGHELAHILLHSYYFRNHVDALAAHADVVPFRLSSRHPCFWLERQADYAAGALVMPRCTFLKLYQNFFRTNFLARLGSESGALFEFITEAKKVYNVSRKAAEIRLEQLNLLGGGGEWVH